MIKLFLLRHAKSSWKETFQEDIDRTLNERGMRDAPTMAARLALQGPEIDYLVCSPAKRTLLTSVYFIQALGIPKDKVKMDDQIYEASLGQLIKIVQSLPSAYHQVLLIGHNPGLGLLLEYFTEEAIELPTCAIAEIAFELDSWKETGRSSGRLCSFDYPKKGL